ncbi:MAG: hypothetical protein AMXMBFR7_31470 [Planctomycetota bacterium]
MAQRGSGRQSARGSARASARGVAPATGSARASARGSAKGSQRGPAGTEDPGRGKPKKRAAGGGGMELVILLAVLGLLLVVCGVLYSMKSSEQENYQREVRAEKAAKEKNDELAYAAFQKALSAGAGFVKGESEKATNDELFASFRSDPTIYNVIFNRQYKDKRNKDQYDQRSMYPERLRVEQYSGGSVKDGVSITRGMAENKTLPIMIAKKMLNGPEGDKANLGGEILVMVRAVKAE